MKENKKIIIGLVGESGSGKDTVADYLEEKYGAILVRFADPLRETLSLYVQNFSREDLQWFFLPSETDSETKFFPRPCEKK
ncbi:MAG: hypothetical protein V1814_00395 [Candidatus Moraniibacteriota bacterium]